MNDPQVSQPSARRWRVPSAGVALLLLLLGWYILTMSGHTYASDEETMLAAGESLIDRGTFVIEREALLNISVGANGRIYSRYGPAQSLANIPLLLVGRAVAGIAPPSYNGLIVRLFLALLTPLITAATALALYAWVYAIGYSTRVALVIGLLYGLTSVAWPYSRTIFAEPLATLFLVVCAYGLRRDSPRWWALAGAAAAGALAAKFQTLLALPLIAGYAALVCWPGGWRARGRALGGRVAFGLLGAALPLGLLFLYNSAIYGGPLRIGYGDISPAQWMTEPWQEPLYGLTLGGKGLPFYAPTILLGLVGMGFRMRQQGRESLMALLLLAAHLTFYTHLPYWHGDGSWGPRYLVFVVPFLYVPAAGLLTALRGSRPAYTLIGVLAIVGFSVQILPILVNFDTYLQISSDHERYFVPSGSPLAGHARIWGERVVEWWARVVPPAGTAILQDGFSYSEGDRSKGEVLPRWSRAYGRIRLYPAGADPIDGTIVVGDHRPWPLPRANFALLLDNRPLDGVRRTDMTGQQIVWELRFQLTPRQARHGAEIDLYSDTWNPTVATTDNPRNEDLGLFVQQLELRQGDRALELREVLPIPQPGKTRRALWLWYQDTPIHHLFDHWIWYLLVAGLPPVVVALLLALIGLPALALFVVGLRGVLAILRSSDDKVTR